ncbi:MAG: polysaccharide biosynthesis/export family protein [Planctomycetota bacterium]|nr:polysaccharide biosynthesis/export family protein [Planctomycetota bacterium]
MHRHHQGMPAAFLPPADMPRELSKTVLPTYTIEPPDILVIEAIHIVPRSPYLLRTGDVIAVSVIGTLPDAPISGAYVVQPGGIVNLGVPYGAANVAGLTVEQAQENLRRLLLQHIREPLVSVSLVEMSGSQQIAGQHLVGPDGTVTLGSYGSVRVVGLNLMQAKQIIERHLSNFLENPEVSVDVFAYNSKVYYIITEGAGSGDSVIRLPVTGNETVLDAIANVNGLQSVSSKRIWIARPTPGADGVQILPVDWQAVATSGATSTNYQLMPGDRVIIGEDKLVATDTKLAKIFAPVQRVLGLTLLTTGTASRLSGKVLNNNNNNGFLGGGGF